MPSIENRESARKVASAGHYTRDCTNNTYVPLKWLIEFEFVQINIEGFTKEIHEDCCWGSGGRDCHTVT